MSEHIIAIKDNQQQTQALVCALPFLRATDVMSREQGSSAADKQMNLQQGIADTYQSIFELAERQRNGKTIPIIATGHLTAVGCSVSESVRDIYIGTLTAFPSSLFPAFNYIALGHLHRPQKVQNTEHIRYSGSPIALSFDETAQQKKIKIIEFDPALALTVTEVDIPAFQNMQVVSGDLTSVSSTIQSLVAEFQEQSIWLEIKLKQDFYLSDVQSELNALVEGSNVEILKISSPKIDINNQWQADQKTTLDNLTPHDLFQRRLEIEDCISAQQKTQLSALFSEVYAQLEEQS